MSTIHNVDILTASNYFSGAAAQLPLQMFSEHELDNVAVGKSGLISSDGLPSNYTNIEIYNSLPRLNDELETVEKWDFTDKNMSTSSIDEYQDYNSEQIISKSALSPYIEYENAFKIPLDSLTYVNRYQYVYRQSLATVISSYERANDKGGKSGYFSSVVVNIPVAPSLFNPFLGVNALGPMENVPLINLPENTDVNIEIDKWTGDGTSYTMSYSSEIYKRVKREDVSDCSIKTLVKLSKPDSINQSSKLGMARYKWADFMYCKDLGKYSNNMLITLRKFPHPIGDNIFNKYGFGEENDARLDLAPDIGRMVAWLGNDNKLEDIVKFSTRETWKELDAEDDQKTSKEDSTPLGALFSIGNPQYMTSFEEGTVGSQNTILGMFASNGGILSNKGRYEDNPAMNGTHYDKNKVYTKKGTVQKTHIYEGKLEFTHTFRLVFDYELRAYENINPKAAFLDLLGNVLATCYRRGTFWGGQHSLIGAPGLGMSNGWKMANEFINDIAETGGGLLANLLSGGKDGMGGKEGADKIAQAGSNVLDTAKQAWNSLSSGGAVKLGQIFTQGLSGMLKNGLGRPQVYAFNSLLKGEPVGLWHVTIGNPRNPILSMGNLIIENTEYQCYGPLGIDDFPTGLKVVVNLKHAKPRDASEIANMFTKGQSTINFNLIGGNSKSTFEQFVDTSEVGKAFSSEMYGTSDEAKLKNAFASVGS